MRICSSAVSDSGSLGQGLRVSLLTSRQVALTAVGGLAGEQALWPHSEDTCLEGRRVDKDPRAVKNPVTAAERSLVSSFVSEVNL